MIHNQINTFRKVKRIRFSPIEHTYTYTHTHTHTHTHITPTHTATPGQTHTRTHQAHKKQALTTGESTSPATTGTRAPSSPDTTTTTSAALKASRELNKRCSELTTKPSILKAKQPRCSATSRHSSACSHKGALSQV